MFNFIIIDDDKHIRKIIENIITASFDIQKGCTIYSFGKFSDFKKDKSLDQIKNEKVIFILDIELQDDYDGIEIASIIRSMKSNLHEIIFLTGFVDYAFNVLNYKINPIAFIKKDENFKNFLKKAVTEAIDKIELSFDGRKITVKKGSTDIEIKEKDIIYAMKNKGTKNLNIVAELYSLEIVETIDSFLGRLGNEFIKIDRSTIINYNNIKEIDVKKRIVTMNNQEIFYIDFKTVKKVMEFGEPHC